MPGLVEASGYRKASHGKAELPADRLEGMVERALRLRNGGLAGIAHHAMTKTLFQHVSNNVPPEIVRDILPNAVPPAPMSNQFSDNFN